MLKIIQTVCEVSQVNNLVVKRKENVKLEPMAAPDAG